MRAPKTKFNLKESPQQAAVAALSNLTPTTTLRDQLLEPPVSHLKAAQTLFSRPGTGLNILGPDPIFSPRVEYRVKFALKTQKKKKKKRNAMRPAALLGQWQCRWRCPSFPVLSDARASSFICIPFATARSTHHGNVHYISRGLKSPDFQMPSYLEEGENNGGSNSSDLDSGEKKSRNQKKREARRAVRWGMELASFAPPQIKRVLRVASLEREVFDALMLVKRLGPDVREGKRRQYNYIGKLLREVEPELMDSLIHATKDGDWSRIEGLSVSEAKIIREDDHDDNDETDYEVEDEDLQERIQIASRWFDGLVNKDPAITNEVYATQTINFDRQELRKLVRKVHPAQKCDTEGNGQGGNDDVIAARKSLTRFLRVLAKQMLSESNHIEF